MRWELAPPSLFAPGTKLVEIIECPHCFTRVAPAADGVCPACKSNCFETSGTDPTKTSLTVVHNIDLAPYCCDCGGPTDRRVKVAGKISRKMEQPSSSLGVFLVLTMFFSFLFLPFALIFGLRKRTSDVVLVRMPQCQACADGGKPKPIRVNGERLTMTFVVDRKFREQNSEL